LACRSVCASQEEAQRRGALAGHPRPQRVSVEELAGGVGCRFLQPALEQEHEGSALPEAKCPLGELGH
ncbi:unnamed protein product, partial [Symbiodinium microadriaticum]